MYSNVDCPLKCCYLCSDGPKAQAILMTALRINSEHNHFLSHLCIYHVTKLFLHVHNTKKYQVCVDRDVVIRINMCIYLNVVHLRDSDHLSGLSHQLYVCLR